MALDLLVAFNSLRRVVGAPAPFDGEREHLRQHRDGAVGAVGCALRDLPVQIVNVTEGDRMNLEMLHGWQHVVVDDRQIVPLRRRPLLGQMLFLEPAGEVRDRLCIAIGLNLSHRIITAVDTLLQALGFLPGRRNRPILDAADRLAALTAALGPVVEDEGAGAGGSHPNAEAFHLVVIGHPVAGSRQREALHDAVG